MFFFSIEELTWPEPVTGGHFSADRDPSVAEGERVHRSDAGGHGRIKSVGRRSDAFASEKSTVGASKFQNGNQRLLFLLTFRHSVLLFLLLFDKFLYKYWEKKPSPRKKRGFGIDRLTLLLVGRRSTIHVERSTGHESRSVTILQKGRHQVQDTFFDVAVGAGVVVHLELPVLQQIRSA